MPPVPKKKHSKARSGRRSSLFANRLLQKAPNLSTCPHCRQMKVPHRICSYCGYYKGREVVAPKTKAPGGS